ncbi:MAG: S-layer protein [Candidatus Micrarchaeota archaeon]|nr:S-layer protein [Candidatus Micrarchaeota archaeon]
MKGINVRKIAAIAGAGILAFGAIAAADVVYGSTQLVDQNGQPTVKIYVGSKAAVSDGVAAANIAAKIANEAYKSSTLTASLSGTPTCTVGAGVSGTGTCSIIESSKKVTLEVTLPGTIAGTHTFKTLITDTIDRMLQNRVSTTPDDVYNESMSVSDTTGTRPSPLRGTGATNAQKQLLYKIGSGEFSAFADYSVVDTQAAGTSYTEEQSFWVGSTYSPQGVRYDSIEKDVTVNKYSALVYSLRFLGNDFGIPVCTGDLNSSASDDWTSCGSESNSMTEKHRVKIKFMGSEWIISEMRDPNVANPSLTAVVNGGQIKLAKESKYGIINVGQVLDAGTFKIRLADISVAVGAENKHPAIIDILDANEAVVGQIQVDPGTTYTFTQSGTGNSVKIHVYKTAPGFTLNAKWAEMAIYSDEITLKDGSRYNLVSTTDTDKDYKVSLLWKNRDFPGGSNPSAASNKTDSLREIVIYRTDNFEKAKAGDSVGFLKSKPTFKVTYQGLDLTDDDYVPLTLESLGPDTYSVQINGGAAGETAACASGTYGERANARWIKIYAGGSQLLGGAGSIIAGGYMLDTVYYDPIGLVLLSGTAGQETWTGGWGNGSALTPSYAANWTNWSIRSPKVFWKVPGRDCYNWANVTSSSALTSMVRFDTAGDNSAAQGALFFVGMGTPNPYNVTNFSIDASTYTGAIVLQEDAGKVNTVSNNLVYTAWPIVTDATTVGSGAIRLQPTSSTTQRVYYKGLSVGEWATAQSVDLKFVSERGSQFTGVSSTSASAKIAKKVGLAQFQFALADTAAASTGEEYVLGVGDTKVFGGVTVKVKAIDATAGSCSVLGPGGTPACTVNTGSVSAVIQPNNAATVEVSEPYKLTSNMVMLDSAGASAGVAILVGGPEVNTLTADALKGSEVDFNVESVVVKEIGNKIVVAGKTAQDTMTAAEQFIAGIKRQ